MNQTMSFLKKMFVLVLFVGLSACGGAKEDALKAEIDETMQAISDQLTSLNAVKMEQESVADGLEEDLKWEYSPEFEEAVNSYVATVEHLNESIAELDGIYEELAGINEKIEKGAPLEYSRQLMTEMAEENIEHFEKVVADIEATQDKLYDLGDQIDQM